MSIEYSQSHRDREREPSREMSQLREGVYKLLNRSLTTETRLALIEVGMPVGEIPSVGNMLEMIAAPELPLLDRATAIERERWCEWVARLIALYRQHIESEVFLGSPSRGITFVQFLDFPEGVPPPAEPFSRSDYAVLSFSAEIARSLGARLRESDDHKIGAAFDFELRRCSTQLDDVANGALACSRTLFDQV
jgi:hypothetical protein